jgi:hypothetical protein
MSLIFFAYLQIISRSCITVDVEVDDDDVVDVVVVDVGSMLNVRSLVSL